MRRDPVNSLAIPVLMALQLLVPGQLTRGDEIMPRVFRDDDFSRRASQTLVKGSHVKISIPSLPYVATSHSVNGALIQALRQRAGVGI